MICLFNFTTNKETKVSASCYVLYTMSTYHFFHEMCKSESKDSLKTNEKNEHFTFVSSCQLLKTLCLPGCNARAFVIVWVHVRAFSNGGSSGERSATFK